MNEVKPLPRIPFQIWIAIAALGLSLLGMLLSPGCSRTKTADPGGQPNVITDNSGSASNQDPPGHAPDALPDAGLQGVLNNLRLDVADDSFVAVRVKSFSAKSVFSGLASPGKPALMPLQARRQIVLQLRPDLTPDDLEALFSEHDVRPIRVFPQIGVVVVQIPDSAQVKATAAVQVIGEVDDLELSKQVDRFAQDARIYAAVPNSILSTFQLSSAVTATGKPDPAALGGAEQQDWGIDDAHIAEVWPKLTKELTVGVIDVGFADHDDLKMRKGLPAAYPKEDHGNHVSGIMCAKHNQIAVRGVLTHCTVVTGSSQKILDQAAPVGADNVISWSAYFTEYIGSVLDFISANPDVKVINLSLGYNWIPNYNQDPRLEQNLRDIIAGEGRIYLSILQVAARQDIAIVSAAGNDSDDLDKPLEAKWASPFNFGANLMQATSHWSNALVVEAHDREGKRASFSNVGGDISCPGVDILSTTSESATSVARLSGTSMASPYCAGALAALRSVLPGVTLRNAMRCIRRSPRVSGTVPILDLSFAISHCSNNVDVIAAEERADTIKLWSDFLSRNDTPTAATAQTPCRYGLRREFRVTNVADLGDGQGPEISDPARRSEVKTYAAELVASKCRDTAMIALRFGFDPAYQRRLNFAMAVMNEVYKARYPGGAALVEYPQIGDENKFENLADQVVVIVGDPEFAGHLQQGK